MQKIKRITTLLCAVCTLTFLGDAPRNAIIVLTPVQSDSISYEQGRVFIASAQNELGKELLVATQWEIEKHLGISTKEQKDNFPKEFIKLFPPQSTIQTLSYSFMLSSGYTKPETLSYKYADSMSIRKFWQTPTFTTFLKRVKEFNAPSILLTIKGWKDSLYTTEYDDPANDSRSLFKINLSLIPGKNILYFASTGQPTSKLEYAIDYIRESKPVEARESRFHNSEYEQNCTSCHEGLPSSISGENMTADCSSCHKAISNGTKIHPPVEMKECSSCHSWSKEKNSVVVKKGVPEVCYDCHVETKSTVENSTTPHAVASECGVCHSPHSSNKKTLLEDDIFRICSSCHENYTQNHPIERHPVRFTKIEASKDEEISCVSCHNPHGSDNKAMMKVAGGRMAICLNCHNK
ncbi:MAG: cytochrome c3 family protein [Bacteroidota bacterium]|nr:cytochrome c3 family protein [Bacteroidota bacterium]